MTVRPVIPYSDMKFGGNLSNDLCERHDGRRHQYYTISDLLNYTPPLISRSYNTPSCVEVVAKLSKSNRKSTNQQKPRQSMIDSK
ncbi:hypothetical protein SK128_025612 [Halocaridina rubra]|uniref:Uncharacterized protein n=1 Tax=Halocaridina rubra TaxID=373956 RepID=A0AAN8XJG9_HALRR